MGREVSRLDHQGEVSAVAFSPDGKLVATGSGDNTARVFEAATGHEVSRLTHQREVSAVAFSPNGNLFIAQTGNWLHLYQRNGRNWRPVANRHVPVIWPHTVRFVSPQGGCPRCVELLRDVAENLLKLDRINFAAYDGPPIVGDPQQLVSEWSAKLGLTIDAHGRITPLTSK
jgi:WD40 repeat protein